MPALIASATPLAGLVQIDRVANGDFRGSFSRIFCDSELAQAGWSGPVRQSNLTETHQAGTIRGLHYQHPPQQEDKLVTCIDGDVFDVAVDLRAGSPSFLHWHAVHLSRENLRSLLIPRGFAHGFQVLSDSARMLYFHSAAYAPEYEDGLHPEDPCLAIAWPLPVARLSPRDSAHPFIPSDFRGLATCSAAIAATRITCPSSISVSRRHRTPTLRPHS